MATKKASNSSSGKSSTKTNVNRVTKAVKKYDTSKSVKNNAEAIGGVVTATATSAKRSANKKQKTFFIVLLVILIIAIVAAIIYGYYHGWFDAYLNPDGQYPTGGSNTPTEDYNVTAIKNETLSIHFLELGNKYTGDCVYIKAGDTDILIDAGSREGSAATIAGYVNQYCTDGILEYVIVTHAHQDHIAGFVGTNSVPGIFARYECKNIIQFANTNATSNIYKNYVTARDAEKAAGANVYTALDCVNNANGAQKVYNLTDDGSVTMEILYQKYYETNTTNENNFSVCVLISQGDNHYLFTGDLEGDGETSLVNSNPNLPKVELWKGGHHGSYTAASAALMAKIQPQRVCICTCMGTTEYSSGQNIFPAQSFIDRVAPYTDEVYVTTHMIDYQSGQYESANGDIVFACTNGNIKMFFSNNDTKLKDTDWFKQNRTCPDAWKSSE